MKHVAELERIAYLPSVTLGCLRVAGEVFFTLERPWIPNRDGPGGLPRESCVPDGIYALRPHDSLKFPHTYALEAPELGVYYQALPDRQAWGRTAILIHAGNVVRDVVGCIAIGLRFGTLHGQQAVLDSTRALERLREILRRTETHELRIRPTAGTEELR